jgi:hypothetical protein
MEGDEGSSPLEKGDSGSTVYHYGVALACQL